MLKSSAFIAILAVACAQPPSPYFSFGGQPSPFSGAGSPSPFSGGQSSSPFGGPSPSPFSGGQSPFGSPFSSGRPGSPSPFGRPGKRPGANSPSKLFSWLGSTMSKNLAGLMPKIQYNSPKPKGPRGPGQNAPAYFSQGAPQIPSSVFESSSSPFSGNSVTFANPNSIEHPPVFYRQQRPSASPFSRPQSFGSRPFSFSSGGPSFAPRPYPFASSERPSSPGPRPFRNNLEVFPSQQVNYQSPQLSQNDGFTEALNSLGLQNLYGAQSQTQKPQSLSNFEQHSSFSQPQPFRASNNYGATFHNIEPVRVAPIYDIADHFKPSATDISASNQEANQQQNFANLVNQYAQQAEASTGQQMISALQSASSDLMSSSTNNLPIPGVQVLGNGNPVFEVVADANAPTFDGHPIDLNKLISMIEPGAQIDTIPNYSGEAQASEPQPVYVPAPENMDSNQGNNQIFKLRDNFISSASDNKPAVVKLDGTLVNEQLIREHFDKDLIFETLQDKNDTGFILIGVKAEDYYDGDENGHLQIDNDFENETNSTTQHPNHNYDPQPYHPLPKNYTDDNNYPKINPIFDQVRPGRTMSIRTSVKSSVSEDQEVAPSSINERHLDYDDLVNGEDDLLAEASRNVKSVAIIVTPPPYYVKIKNKYKKEVTPLSMKVTTTPSSKENSSSSLVSSKSEEEGEEEALDKFLSEMGGGRSEGGGNGGSGEVATIKPPQENGKRARLYPVYRGRPT